MGAGGCPVVVAQWQSNACWMTSATIVIFLFPLVVDMVNKVAWELGRTEYHFLWQSRC